MVMAFTDEPPEEYRPFEAWPQHITVVPWMQGRRLQATNRISDAVQGTALINITIDSESLLGKNDVAVWMLAPSIALASLQQVVYAAATKVDTKIEDDSYIGDNYRPHITKKLHQPNRIIGESLTLSQLAVVGKHDNHRMVFKNIALCGSDSTKH